MYLYICTFIDIMRVWWSYNSHWVGNDNIHLISSNGAHELSIDMERPNGLQKWGNYSVFRIEDETSKYVLRVSGYSGDVRCN